jgi:hypothetical protein
MSGMKRANEPSNHSVIPNCIYGILAQNSIFPADSGAILRKKLDPLRLPYLPYLIYESRKGVRNSPNSGFLHSPDRAGTSPDRDVCDTRSLVQRRVNWTEWYLYYSRSALRFYILLLPGSSNTNRRDYLF